jgi:hypothetical protein
MGGVRELRCSNRLCYLVAVAGNAARQILFILFCASQREIETLMEVLNRAKSREKQ